MLTEEASLKAKCRAYLKRLGAYRFSPVQMGMGATTVDDLFCLRGRFCGVEYKAAGKRPTPRQDLTMREIKTAGGAAFWCDSFDGFLLNLAVWGLDGEMATEQFVSRPRE